MRVTHGWRTLLAALALLASVAVVSHRVVTRLSVPGGPDASRLGLADFRDAVYYPVVDFLAGENPYDHPRYLARYPVEVGIGVYSPATLILHLPFGLMSPVAAARAYHVAMLVGTIALGAVGLRLCGVRLQAPRVLGLGALLVVTRPGEWNLFNGQVALQTAFATWAALWWGPGRPLLGGLGLAVASFKVTYMGPLLFLMLARGDRRAVAVGVVLAVMLNAAAMVPIVSRTGAASLVASVAGSYTAVTRLARERSDSFALRVDGGALLGRLHRRPVTNGETLLVALATLLPAGYSLRRLAGRGDREARLLSLAAGSTAIALSAYRQQYDLLILAVVLVWLLWPSAESLWRRRPRVRAAALVLTAIPFVNYVASFSAAAWLGLDLGALLVASSVNAVALLALLGLLIVLAAAEPREPRPVQLTPCAREHVARLKNPRVR